MSHAYYSTRLYWSAGRGVAKLHGVAVALVEPPRISGQLVDGIDYTPEVQVARILPRLNGWRDMERDEIAEADLILRLMTAHHEGTPHG